MSAYPFRLGGQGWRRGESPGGGERRIRGVPGGEADSAPAGRPDPVQVLAHIGRLLGFLPLRPSQVGYSSSVHLLNRNRLFANLFLVLFILYLQFFFRPFD